MAVALDEKVNGLSGGGIGRAVHGEGLVREGEGEFFGSIAQVESTVALGVSKVFVPHGVGVIFPRMVGFIATVDEVIAPLDVTVSERMTREGEGEMFGFESGVAIHIAVHGPHVLEGDGGIDEVDGKA